VLPEIGASHPCLKVGAPSTEVEKVPLANIKLALTTKPLDLLINITQDFWTFRSNFNSHNI